MLRFPRISGIFVSRNPVNVLACSAFVIGFLFATRTNAQVVATYGFEDGTADGWTSFNGATAPIATNAAAYAGSYSLQTTTGSTGQGGPSINVSALLLAGAKYTITGYVRLQSGESATNANFTIKRSDPSCSGGTCFDTIGTYQVPVNDTGWAAIGGSYTWLDGFPVARTDYPLPFDMGLQAKPAYWGIVDPTKLPGYGMTFALSTGVRRCMTREHS